MLLVCGGYWFVCTQEWLPFGICFFTQLPLVFQGFQVAVRDLAWGGGFFGDIPEGGEPVFVPLKQIIKTGVR